MRRWTPGSTDWLSGLQARASAPSVLYLSASGGSAGAGTYIDAAIRAAGGRNIIAESGAAGWTRSDPRFALTAEADLIVTSFFVDGYAGLNNPARYHSAYQAFIGAGGAYRYSQRRLALCRAAPDRGG